MKPITVNGTVLRGSFDRTTAEMKAASLENLANALENDLARDMDKVAGMTFLQRDELKKRIERHLEDARQYRLAVQEYDRRASGDLTPGEEASFIRKS